MTADAARSEGDAATRYDAPGGADGAPGYTAAEIAALAGGVLDGDPAARVTAVAPLGRARVTDVSFLASRQYADEGRAAERGVVFVSAELAQELPTARARIVVDNPHEAMLSILPLLYRAPRREAGVHRTAELGRGVVLGPGVSIDSHAVIGDGATVGEGSWIGAHTVLGAGASIGRDVQLHPHVTLYPGTAVGDRTIVHAGVRLGSDGFGYVFREGAHVKIPHVGRCIVHEDVEIGANSTIDRGSIDDTVVGAGTKIDNLVHLGHNVKVGRLCLIMAQVGVAGSAVIGDGCVVAGQAGIGGHLEIGARARIAGQAGVFGDVPAGESWSGYPARPHREALRAQAALFRLSGMMRKLERLIADGR